MGTMKTISRNLAVAGLAAAFTATTMAGFGRAKFSSMQTLPSDSVRTENQARKAKPVDFESDMARMYRLVGAKLPDWLVKKSPDQDTSGSGPKIDVGATTTAKAREEDVKHSDAAPGPAVPKYSQEDDNSAREIIDSITTSKLASMGKEELAQELAKIASLDGKVSPVLRRGLVIAKANIEERVGQIEAAEAKLLPVVEKPSGSAALAPVAPAQEALKADEKIALVPKKIVQADTSGKAPEQDFAGKIDEMYGRMNASPDSATAVAIGQEVIAFFKANKAALRADSQVWAKFMGKLVNGANIVLDKFGCEAIDARMFIRKD